MGQLKSKSIVLLLSILLIPLIVFGETIVNNDFIWVDNIKIDGNTISSEDTDGNVILNPNGTGNVRFPDLTASRVVYLDASNNLVSSDITYTTLTYLDATSSIQTQIDGAATALSNHASDTTTHGTTGDIVGTTDSQTLTNKTIETSTLDEATMNRMFIFEQASDPSNPISSYQTLYGKTDNDLYHIDSSGNVTNLNTHGLSGAIVGTSDSQTLTNKTINAANNTITTSPSGNLTSTDLDSALAELQTDVDSRFLTSSILDEDNMASDSATLPATQQSIKAYVDAEIAGVSAGATITPTVQIFTSGSGTYTTPSGPSPAYLKIRMVGGGGGGGGSGVANGTASGAGGNTTFSTRTAGGGAGGARLTAGAGGGASGTGHTVLLSLVGGAGAGGGVNANPANATQLAGGNGGSSPFGGAGWSGAGGGGAGGITNSGSGGGGGGNDNVGGSYSGGGGGAGGYVELIIDSPTTSYSYAVGAGGTAGGAGTSGRVGGAGGSGVIIVEEHY